MKERDASNVPMVSYTRGTDLSGSLDSSALPGSFDATRGAGSSRQSGATAGGIGGLLARSHGYSSGTGNWSTHNFYHADGNGSPREIEHEPWQRDPGGGPNLPQPPSNPSLSHGEIITYLVNSSQTVAASYRYDPFGNTTAQSGTLANANVYRFSSKEVHANSGMYYYGYRFYDANVQRWLNRDPLGELDSTRWASKLAAWTPGVEANLFAFIGNTTVNSRDAFGLSLQGGNSDSEEHRRCVEDCAKKRRERNCIILDAADRAAAIAAGAGGAAGAGIGHGRSAGNRVIGGVIIGAINGAATWFGITVIGGTASFAQYAFCVSVCDNAQGVGTDYPTTH